ncbi:dynein assembly factor 4, axonemal [Culex quinquefasciatus]|uniref:dynein assembly factor 4, axonemal n=1 Tax=Culex quinquefasciatus TaxID=7176 RepID=UPI0018E30087|nr:dynein assembly factor 4, axonemal [Culex quinquefasciatus]
MPVILKQVSWSQEADQVTIRVQFPENYLRPEEVFTSEQFLKINKPPYYWEALLANPILDRESRCAILENEVVFNLRKKEPGLEWTLLELDVPRGERVRLKEELLAAHQKRLEEESKQRLVEKDQKKKEEISRQIERDGNDRTAIENLLHAAKQRELERMAEVKRKDTPRPKAPPPKKEAPPPSAVKKPAPAPLPAIRQSATLQVSFTERNFVTPSRESREPEERDWIQKQSAAKKAIGFVDDDLRPEERNPEWLKAKGDSFFQQQNYLGAISAYTAGIRLTDKYYSLFLNRSAAHFALENYQRCAEDCSAALELLVPPIEANRKARVSCLARRGAALARMGFVRQGYEEMVAAARLDPQNDALRRDAELLGRKLEEEGSSDGD